MKTSIGTAPFFSSIQRAMLSRAAENLLNHWPLFDLLIWELVLKMLHGILSTKLPICTMYSVHISEYRRIFTHESLYKDISPSAVDSHVPHVLSCP